MPTRVGIRLASAGSTPDQKPQAEAAIKGPLKALVREAGGRPWGLAKAPPEGAEHAALTARQRWVVGVS